MSLPLHALQVEAHHYCSHLNEEVRQCIIYDSANNNARLIGIEYIISRRLFESLPEEEKKLWHSHQYEVRFSFHEALPVHVAVISAGYPSSPDKRCLRSRLVLLMAPYLGQERETEWLTLQVMSGMLYAPGVPDSAEIVEMRKLVDTYGKTWHTWQVDRGDTLPLGESEASLGVAHHIACRYLPKARTPHVADEAAPCQHTIWDPLPMAFVMLRFSERVRRLLLMRISAMLMADTLSAAACATDHGGVLAQALRSS